jgi:hypothetical protein
VVAADPLLGSVVGTYRISHVLGEGGMGRVYAAFNPQIAGRVAIKVLSSHAPDLVARFFAEARAVNLIAHRAIVKVHDLAELPDGRAYIVMELVEGETLRTVIRRDSPLPLGGIARLFGQVLGGLGAAHAIGIVHRDLKPDNIMVGADGATKILDFGIAKLSPWLGGGGPRTVTGARVGTPAYMAPEQIQGGTVDERTDIYTAGVVLFEAVVGRRPFPGDNEFELMRGHLEQPPPSPRQLRGDVPAELDQVILQTLAKRPEDRFQSASALANALAHTTAQLATDQQRTVASRPGQTLQITPAMAAVVEPSRLEAPTAVEPSARRARVATARKRRWPLVAIVLGVAVVGGVTALALRGGGASESRAPGSGSPAPVAAPPVVSPPPVAPQITTLPNGTQKMSMPLDFDPAQFDRLGYIPRAQELARKVIDDADLAGLSISNAMLDSTVLGPAEIDAYMFTSARWRAASSGHAAMVCDVTVVVSTARIQLIAAPSPICREPVRPPACTLEGVSALARARGAPAEAASIVSYSRSGWAIAIVRVGEVPFRAQFPDTCGATPAPIAPK